MFVFVALGVAVVVDLSMLLRKMSMTCLILGRIVV